MKFLLVTYTPLCYEGENIPAIEHYNQPKFIDSSIRREPELESKYPGISAICRADKLVPKLEEYDIVAYLTKKNNYFGVMKKHRRLVAILKVIKKCKNHKEASMWYKERGLPVPSNCIVEGSETLDRHLTGIGCHDDEIYRKRAEEFPEYLICQKFYCELHMPIGLLDGDMINIFGEKNPATETPKVRKLEELKKLIDLLNERVPENERISLEQLINK